METSKPACVVAGVGPGIGASYARRFGKEGYAVALVARSTTFSKDLAASLPRARAFSCDVGEEASVAQAFAAIRAEFGEPEVLLYNAGSGVFAGIEETTAEQMEAAWRVNALGAF